MLGLDWGPKLKGLVGTAYLIDSESAVHTGGDDKEEHFILWSPKYTPVLLKAVEKRYLNSTNLWCLLQI